LKLVFGKQLIVLILALFLSFYTSAQIIVNVENSRIQSDTTGWKGDAATSFSYTKNVQEILNINASLHLQYKTQKDLYLLLGSYSLLVGNGRQLSNNMFYHVRYNRKLGKVVRWEAFTQLQQNRITNIDLRLLFGTGPRFKCYESNRFKLYAAALAMYEHEKDRNPYLVLNDIRSDNYISFTFKPNDIFDVTSTTFYQPLFRDFKDFRILNQLTFSIKATKHFSISTNWDYAYDALPPAGIPNINFTITNGFHYVF
jgi:hypothetical protein